MTQPNTDQPSQPPATDDVAERHFLGSDGTPEQVRERYDDLLTKYADLERRLAEVTAERDRCRAHRITEAVDGMPAECTLIDTRKLEKLASDRNTAIQRAEAAEAAIAATRKALEGIVCTADPDKGVILLSDDGPTHKETIGGRTFIVYDLENFSPLGDALVKAWELTALDAAETPQ